jgi:hypothetical protein
MLDDSEVRVAWSAGNSMRLRVAPLNSKLAAIRETGPIQLAQRFAVAFPSETRPINNSASPAQMRAAAMTVVLPRRTCDKSGR